LAPRIVKGVGHTTIGGTRVRNYSIILTAAVLVVGLTAGCRAADKTFDKKFSVKPGGTLYLETDVGEVRVTGGSGDEVAIKVEIKGSDSFVKDFEVTATQEGGDVRVKGDLPKSFWKMFSNGNHDAKFTLTVPRKYNVNASTAGGDVMVTGIEGETRGSTSGGDISAIEVKGKVTIGTSGGDVEIRKVEGMVEAETSGGDVKVSSVKGDVDVSTSGGNVRVESVEGAVKAETSGGNVLVTVRGGNKGIRAETSGGNVEIAVASNVGAELDAGTSGGNVDCDIPVTVKGKLSESSVKGTINGGGPLIYAHTSGGNVKIRSASAE
jgi:DUF4097 and DUF4098 domain-containing protein YvlB